MLIYTCTFLSNNIIMSISTLQTISPGPMRRRSGPKAIVYIIPAIIIALLLVFFGRPIIESIGKIGGKSAISVDVSSGRAEISVNDEFLGVTPYESQEIKPGTNKITVRSTNRQYETTIKFLSNNDKYIHKVGVFRDLGISDLFSSGQDLWFDEDDTDTVLRIISDPGGATVYIDNTEIGKTPFTSSKLTEGDYDLRIEQVGYEEQRARIRIQRGYTSNVSVKLFPMPVPSRVSVFEGSADLFDISTDNNQISADPGSWVKGAVYWNQTRGINLEGIGVNKELVFDYYLDYNGNIYDHLGDLAETEEEIEELKGAVRGAYLGRVSDGAGITEMAREGLSNFKGLRMNATDEMVEILPTGLGWLRVRSDPSTNGTEVTKVDVGEQFPVLEERTGWVKIIVSDEVEGWVSSTYTKKVEPEEDVLGILTKKSDDKEKMLEIPEDELERDGTEDTLDTDSTADTI